VRREILRSPLGGDGCFYSLTETAMDSGSRILEVRFEVLGNESTRPHDSAIAVPPCM
jgi:hypothetical protein